MIRNRPCWSPSGDGDGGGPRVDVESLLGKTVVERYTLEEVVGQGPVATVFRATDAETDQPVAVKMLEPLLDPEGDAARSMVEEVENAASIKHPSLVPVREIGLHEGRNIFVVEPFVGAITLDERIADDGPLKPRVAVRTAREICEGLAALHENGIVHLDIKPENIFLVTDAMGSERAVLGGTAIRHCLGLDRAKDRDPSLCRAKPEYITPEAVGGRQMDARSDVYLLGLVLYEMLCGRPAFSAAADFKKTARRHAIERPLSPRIIRRQAQISKSLDALVMRCLEKTPNRRFESMRDLISALDEIATSDDDSRNRTSLNFRPISSLAPAPRQADAEPAETVAPAQDAETAPPAAISAEMMQNQKDPPSQDGQMAAAQANEAMTSDGKAVEEEVTPDGLADAPDETPNHAGEGNAGADDSPGENPKGDEATEAEFDAAGSTMDVPKIIVTDPRMRAMTQPLGSSGALTISASGEAQSEQKADISTAPNEASPSPGDPDTPQRAAFRETGQWFVESVEELEAVTPRLDEYDEFDIPKERNLFPWVMGALVLVVIAVFAFWEPPQEPEWKAKLRSDKSAETAATEVTQADSNTPKPIESETIADAAGDKVTPDAASTDGDASVDEKAPPPNPEVVALEAAVKTGIAQSKWDGDDGVLQGLVKLKTLAPDSQAVGVLRGEAMTGLLAGANAALKVEDFEQAEERARQALKLSPSSIVAQQVLKSASLGRKAKERNAAQAAQEKQAAADAAQKREAEAKKAAAARKRQAEAAKKKAERDAKAKQLAAQKREQRAAAAKRAEAKATAAKNAAAAKQAADAKKKANAQSVKELVNRGNQLLKNGRLSDASSTFKRALRANGRAAAAHAGLGKVAQEKGKFTEAIKHHKRSVKYASRNATYHVNLAFAYFKVKDYPRAKTACEKALSINPGNAKAKRYLKVINKKLK